jgi:uncharacterized delta-60 repeat protein
MQKNLLFAVKLAVIAFIIFIQTLETKAAWGDFDTSFGFQGVAGDTITGYHPHSVTIQTDGKILVTGYRITPFGGKGFFLRRYQSNGQLDTTFGTNGAATGPESNSFNTDYRGDKIVVQANGKIAVAGWANDFYAVWQFTSSGTRDKTFGENGLQRLTNYPVTANSYAQMNIQSGKLLLSLGKEKGNTCRVALIRLTSSGTFDATFGSGGEAVTEISGCSGNGTVVETDGKITVGGVKFDDISAKGFERKLANGQDDSTFSPPSIFSFGITGTGLVKMANGKYTMRWGNLASNGTITFYLDKFSSIGVFESNITPYNGSSIAGCPEVFTNQNNGKLIVNFAGLLFRLNDELDGSSIETNVCPSLSGMTGFSRAAIQTDDKMIVAGVYNNYLMLVRLLPD